jgi:predicted transporter
VESFIATGLGIMTTIALAASTAVAALIVRRRDLLSVMVCPPIVFTAVAVVNMVAAPSVHISGVKAFGLLMVTTLVQNFPAMGIATGLGLVIGLIRLAARR